MSSPPRDPSGHILPSDPHPSHGTHAARSWRRHRRLVVIAVPPVAVLAVFGVLFALYWNPASAPPVAASPPATLPNLNPANIPILSVLGSVRESGMNPGMVTIAGGDNLCPQCPVVPQATAALNPPEVRFLIYFNLSDSGGTSTNVTFGISVSGGSGTDPFSLYAVLCCSPGYGETVEALFLTAGQSLGSEAIVVAPAISAYAESGYNFVLGVTYSPV
jgi:hypothetical protein